MEGVQKWSFLTYFGVVLGVPEWVAVGWSVGGWGGLRSVPA